MVAPRMIFQTVVSVLFTVASVRAHAMMEADKFIGAWRLVSAEFRSEDGAPADSPYGHDPQGILMYDAQGVMSVQIARKDRQPFGVADRLKGTPEEARAAFES